MARITVADVTTILDTDLTDPQVSEFIDDASGWVDSYLLGRGLSDDELKRIEKYLSAHFVTLRDPRVTSENIGDASNKLQRDAEVSEYLRTAAAMDPTGTVEDRLLPDGSANVAFRVGAGFDDELNLPETVA